MHLYIRYFVNINYNQTFYTASNHMFKVQNDHILLLNLIMNIKLISNCRVKCSYLSNKLLNFPLKVANTSSVDHCLVYWKAWTFFKHFTTVICDTNQGDKGLIKDSKMALKQYPFKLIWYLYCYFGQVFVSWVKLKGLKKFHDLQDCSLVHARWVVKTCHLQLGKHSSVVPKA